MTGSPEPKRLPIGKSWKECADGGHDQRGLDQQYAVRAGQPGGLRDDDGRRNAADNHGDEMLQCKRDGRAERRPSVELIEALRGLVSCSWFCLLFSQRIFYGNSASCSESRGCACGVGLYFIFYHSFRQTQAFFFARGVNLKIPLANFSKSGIIKPSRTNRSI